VGSKWFIVHVCDSAETLAFGTLLANNKVEVLRVLSIRSLIAK